MGEILQIVRWFRRLNENLLVVISGGEPLLRSDCLDIVESILQEGGQVKLLTNGTLITPQRARRMAKLGHFVQVSLTGPPAEADAALRGENAFSRSMQGIRLLIENGLSKKLSVAVILHRRNAEHVREAVELLVKLGVRRVGFSELVRQGRATECWDDISPSLDQIIHASIHIAALKTSLQKEIDIYTSDWFFALLPYRLRGESPPKVCTRHLEIAISYNGEVGLCETFEMACQRRGAYFPIIWSDIVRSEGKLCEVSMRPLPVANTPISQIPYLKARASI